MGWSSGSGVMGGIISAIKTKVPNEKTRIEIYKSIINVLEGNDWDTQDECLGEDPAFDAAIKELHPAWYDEED